MMLEEVTQRESLPYPIGLHRIVCYGDYGLYLISGATYRGSCPGASASSNNLYNAQMYKFSLSTKKWTKMASIVPSFTDEHADMVSVKRRPENTNIVLVSRCAAFLDRRRLMIAGGRLLNGDFNVASYSTYVYDVVSQTTREMSAGSNCADAATRLPTSHRDFFDQTLLRWNDTYILCSRVLDEGTGRKRFLFHSLFTREDDAGEGNSEGLSNMDIGWREVSPDHTDNGSAEEPLAGDLCELAIHDDFVYCIDKNDIENCLDVQWRYDLRSRKWECVESVADLSAANSRAKPGSLTCGKPVDRMFTSCVTYGDSVYVVGGSAMTWAGPRTNPVLSDIWRLHLPTLRWSLLPARLPEGLWFHSVDVSPSGCMYVFGGFTDLAGRKPTRKLWRVYLEAPPTLSSLCWRSILKASDFRLEENNDDELRDMRVPLCFVSALRW